MAPALLPEIWLLVLEDLTAQQDFNALFNLSLVDRGMASVALRQLYSIHENASASADDASAIGKAKLAKLWRSIILSSMDKTLFPYCLWIRNLRLGNLIEILKDISISTDLRDTFFKGDMEPFHLQDAPPRATRGSKPPRLYMQDISNKVGETITSYVKIAAERENKTMALTNLEGEYIPMALLPTWVSRLSLLTSLAIHDGSVLGPPVAIAIRENCPFFKELRCFYCNGPTVDDDMGGFFENLRKNTLESFNVISLNGISGQTFRALGTAHPNSLKKLGLSMLQGHVFQYLPNLSPCTAIESLAIEAGPTLTINWESEYNNSFLETVSWLSTCTSLKQLQLYRVPSATMLLGEVLKAPGFQLKDLDLKLVDSDPSFYTSLGHQKSLESLALQSTDDNLEPSRAQHTELIRSICQCHSLEVLDLMRLMLSLTNLSDIASSLKRLEEFSFDGDYCEDEILGPLSSMDRLKAVNINAITGLSFVGIMSFIGPSRDQLPNGSSRQTVLREGFTLYIMNQESSKTFSAEEEAMLERRMIDVAGGRVEIQYSRIKWRTNVVFWTRNTRGVVLKNHPPRRTGLFAPPQPKPQLSTHTRIHPIPPLPLDMILRYQLHQELPSSGMHSLLPYPPTGEQLTAAMMALIPPATQYPPS